MYSFGENAIVSSTYVEFLDWKLWFVQIHISAKSLFGTLAGK